MKPKNKIKLLLFFDSMLVIFVWPVTLFMRVFRILRPVNLKISNGRVLIIKFMGAGNLVAISTKFNKHSLDFLTTNQTVIARRFFNGRDSNFYAISLNSPFALIYSFIKILRIYFGGQYLRIVNLESESVLAKLFVCTIPAQTRVGLTNTYRSWLDYLIYDKYLVSGPAEKIDMYDFLIGESFQQIINPHSYSSVESLQNKFLMKHLTQDKSLKIIVAPTCSELDNDRRVNISEWQKLFRILEFRKHHYKIIFPNTQDIQYEEFKKVSSEFSNFEIAITSYEDFVEDIKNADLVLTIDSQALHVSQVFCRPTIAFYGPTSPFGIMINEDVFPLYKALVCSPCTHKYFEKPCMGQSFCTSGYSLNRLKEHFSEFERLTQVL